MTSRAQDGGVGTMAAADWTQRLLGSSLFSLAYRCAFSPPKPKLSVAAWSRDEEELPTIWSSRRRDIRLENISEAVVRLQPVGAIQVPSTASECRFVLEQGRAPQARTNKDRNRAEKKGPALNWPRGDRLVAGATNWAFARLRAGFLMHPGARARCIAYFLRRAKRDSTQKSVVVQRGHVRDVISYEDAFSEEPWRGRLGAVAMVLR